MTILYRVNAGQLPPDHWSHDETEGGGRVIGEVCHFVDFAQFMTGALPVSVAAASVPRGGGAGFVDDSVSASIGFSDGSIASIVYAAGGDPSVAKERVEIFCDRTVAVIEDFKEGSFVKGAKKIKLGGGSQDKGHAAEISAFLAAARGKAGPPISLESLVATTLVTFAILDSARAGRSIAIDLPGFFS
jgi:predicted dehydrogenase